MATCMHTKKPIAGERDQKEQDEVHRTDAISLAGGTLKQRRELKCMLAPLPQGCAPAAVVWLGVGRVDT